MVIYINDRRRPVGDKLCLMNFMTHKKELHFGFDFSLLKKINKIQKTKSNLHVPFFCFFSQSFLLCTAFFYSSFRVLPFLDGALYVYKYVRGVSLCFTQYYTHTKKKKEFDLLRMEGKKIMGSSFSSASAALVPGRFGSKVPPSASTGIFASLFAPTSTKVFGRESLRPAGAKSQPSPSNEPRNKGQLSPPYEPRNNSQLSPPYEPRNNSQLSPPNVPWNTMPPASGNTSRGNVGSMVNYDFSFLYEDPSKPFPCTLSSSIYYGGQDLYPRPQQESQAYVPNYFYKNENGQDDTQYSARGEWWQGSVYY